MGKLSKYSYKQVKGLECLNCQQPLTGNENFCSYCGQKNSTKKLSVKHFFSQLFSGFFSYDSRFWTTFIPLLIKPGKVSKDYISGKRIRYVNPFQLYLNVSIIFFLILGTISSFTNIGDDLKIDNDKIALGNQKIDSTLTELKKDSSLNKEEIEAIDKINNGWFHFSRTNDTIKKPYQYYSKSDTVSIESINLFNKLEDFKNFYETNPKLTDEKALDSLGYPKTFWNRFYYQQASKVQENLSKIENDRGKSYLKTVLSKAAIALFVFLPLFTLFLKLLYIRRPYTYMEHLVFVFNTQTVFFLLLTLFYIFGFIAKTDSGVPIVILLFLIYLFIALKTFYKQGYLKTFIKFIILNGIYLVLAIIGVVLLMLISFLIF